MPCWTNQMTTLDLKAADVELLEEALREVLPLAIPPLGPTHQAGWRTLAEAVIKAGFLRVPEGQEAVVGQVKRTYARGAVLKAAKRYGWKVQTTGRNRFAVSRR